MEFLRTCRLFALIRLIGTFIHLENSKLSGSYTGFSMSIPTHLTVQQLIRTCPVRLKGQKRMTRRPSDAGSLSWQRRAYWTRTRTGAQTAAKFCSSMQRFKNAKFQRRSDAVFFLMTLAYYLSVARRRRYNGAPLFSADGSSSCFRLGRTLQPWPRNFSPMSSGSRILRKAR